LKFGRVVTIFPNLVANNFKSHVVVNGLVTFWLICTSECLSSFEIFFHTCPTFIHANLSKPFVLETNTSNFAIDVVLSQLEKDNLFILLTSIFVNFFPTEINYEIHDKKLLAIVNAFEKWCHLLKGVQHEITMFLDHKNLEYFMTTRVLNQH
jgi:hypothetical protein